jgi:ubiquinone/menaquinone biosynthesis C-methylase UbiE
MKLSQSDQNRIKNFYNSLLKKFGTDSAKTLDWHNKHNQLERFETLTIIGDLNNCTILDFGCGLGDLYGFLKGRYSNFKYLGIDLVPELINEAQKKYPDGEFKVANISEIKQKFDYIFASGSLSYAVEGGREFYYAVIRKMYEFCNKGVGFNMLDGHEYKSDETYQTYYSEYVLEYCKSFANKVRIVTQYELGDFTVLLEK